MPKKQTLPLSDVLHALDHRDLAFFDNLSDEDKEGISHFALMRFMSSCVTRDRDLNEYFLLQTQESVNRHFRHLSKYPDLQWMLTASIGLNTKVNHKWIKPGKGGGSKKVSSLRAILEEKFPTAKDDEIEFLLAKPKSELRDFLRSEGYQQKEIAELVK